MPTFDHITFDPNILNGQPCIRRIRFSVRRVLEAQATYPDRDEQHANLLRRHLVN